MLPTRMAKESVWSIHVSLSRDIKSKNILFNEAIIEKSFKIKPPRTMPPKSESTTFLLYSAKAIAKREGTRERIESSMLELYR